MTAHARLSPSGADRWSVCAASVRATAGFPRRSSIYSAEGTVYHEIAAECLERGRDPYDYVGREMSADGFTFTITEEGAGWIQPQLDWLREQPGKVFVEQEVSTARWLGADQFGTLDVGLVTDDLITIFDWKFGAGQKVDAVGNRQLRLYALGFWDTIARHISDATNFRIIIAQPRVADGFGEWRVTLAELLAFGEEMREAAARTDDPDAAFVPGEKQCFWCDLNPKNEGPGCEAHTGFLLDVIGQKLDDIDDDIAICAPPTLPNRSVLTPEQRYFIVRHRSMFNQWLAALHEESLAAAEAGTPDPGSKMVDGDRGDRKWAGDGDADLIGSTAEAVLIDTLRDQAFTKKLKSPAGVEKLLKPGRKKVGNPDVWNRLQGLITQDEGKPILVPIEDPRPAKQSIHDKLDEEPDPDFDLLK